MPLEKAGAPTPDALQQTIERQIAERTWGRVHRLQVEVTEGRVSVRGYTSRYYDKQLAIQAVLEILSPNRATVDMAIEVGPSEPCAIRGAEHRESGLARRAQPFESLVNTW
jgi:hypothetical protein